MVVTNKEFDFLVNEEPEFLIYLREIGVESLVIGFYQPKTNLNESKIDFLLRDISIFVLIFVLNIVILSVYYKRF